MMEDKKPFYKRWWFFLIIAIIILGRVGIMLGSDDEKDNSNEESQDVITHENNADDVKKDESKEEKKREDRTINEKLEEDERDVDKARLEDGLLRLEKNVTSFWDETSILKQDVLKMFEILPEAFEDDEVDRVRVVFNIEMIDQKGNKEVEPAIYFEYSRAHFEELAYDDFLWMATSETWRILNESTSYEIHPGIYQNVKDDYKNNLSSGISKIEE